MVIVMEVPKKSFLTEVTTWRIMMFYFGVEIWSSKAKKINEERNSMHYLYRSFKGFIDFL